MPNVEKGSRRQSVVLAGSLVLTAAAMFFGTDQEAKPVSASSDEQKAGTAPAVTVIPAAPPGIIIVNPEVVRPEVVKPEVVKVPELVTVVVPVPATPNPDIISLHKDQFAEEVERRAEKIAEDKQPQLQQTAVAKVEPTVAAAKTAQALAEARASALASKGWGFDWWSGLIGGAVGVVVSGLLLSCVRPVRVYVVRRLVGPPGTPVP